MKIAIVGGGFTGLSAAYKLSQKKHQVFLFEKEKVLGGLAASFRLPGWQWPVEQHYHHWFSNDYAALNLIKELGLDDKLIFPKSNTDIYFNGKIYPFNTPLQVLNFTPLSVSDRVRTGLVTAFLKLLSGNSGEKLEKYPAHLWLKKYYGKKVYAVVWEPLLAGKFGKYADEVNMAWFWARIKKRTMRLGYLEGGYDELVSKIAGKIKENGGIIKTGTPFDPSGCNEFDKLIVTVPSSLAAKMFPQFPPKYKEKLESVRHLHALNLLLITREKFLKETYWLNINDRSFPFIAIVQQTNLVDSKYYGGDHLTWIGNYLPQNHAFLKMTKEQLFKLYYPYLQKINPKFNLQPTTHNLQLFTGPFAQPIFPLNYSKIKPDFTTPLPNVYLANMDMVYPWDRGTNYAIEMGMEVAERIMI